MEITLDRMKAVIMTTFKQNYLKFDGRVSKNDFWNFLVGMLIVGTVVGIVANILGKFGMVINAIYGLAILLPNIGIGIRRMHDTDKSGMYLLINLVPCIGTILYLMQAWKDGNPAENQYGPVPEDTTAMPA